MQSFEAGYILYIQFILNLAMAVGKLNVERGKKGQGYKLCIYYRTEVVKSNFYSLFRIFKSI